MIQENQQLPEPEWLGRITDPAERDQARVRFYVALAAVYATEQCNVKGLAEAIGCTPNALSVAKSRGVITPEMAIAIEREVGRPRFARELFRPDLFVIAED